MIPFVLGVITYFIFFFGNKITRLKEIEIECSKQFIDYCRKEQKELSELVIERLIELEQRVKMVEDKMGTE